MSMFTEDERKYFIEMRKITTDENKNEVLVGLTFEETVFYMDYARQRCNGKHNSGDASKYLELHNKHEDMRRSILGAEICLRDNPTLH